MHVHVPRQPGLDDVEVEGHLRSYFGLKEPPVDADDMAKKYKEWAGKGVVQV